jgi:CheY-like chemotaxis protein
MPKIQSLCVVDDDVIYQFAVKLTIQQLGLAGQVLTFSNGELAMDYFIENAKDASKLPDVLLLDINMPVMDGWDFLNWFSDHKKILQKEIPIFMVSSSIDWRDIERAKGFEEVIDYVSKPLTDGSFFEILEKLEEKTLRVNEAGKI